jgi:hypothetical protein
MRIFFGRHLAEQFCRRRVIVFETVSVVGIDAPMLLLEGDGKRQDFPLAQFRKGLQGGLPLTERLTIGPDALPTRPL